jgi:ribosomal protein S18 acetylase RimI-like enzyme
MPFRIIEEAPDVLPEYEKISIAFRVESRFRVELPQNGLGGIRLVEETVSPYIKDYDEYQNYRPTEWTKRFDVSSWGILSAFDGKTRVGGAAIVCNSPEIEMLEGLTDLACLWDLRVHPDYRNQGVGHRLFTRALVWSQKRHCRLIKIETQNVNVPACRFYARQGCELGAIDRFAYPDILNETQLIWYRTV